MENKKVFVVYQKTEDGIVGLKVQITEADMDNIFMNPKPKTFVKLKDIKGYLHYIKADNIEEVVEDWVR